MIYSIKLGILELKQQLVCVCVCVIDRNKEKGEKEEGPRESLNGEGGESEVPSNRANSEKREHRRELIFNGIIP